MRRQAGFTFLELTIAAAASGVIMLAASGFLLKALGWYDELSAKLEMNRHAREVYEVLALGGRAATAGSDGTQNVYGIRGMNKKPAGTLRSNYAFQYKVNNLTLTPDTFAGMTIECIGPNNPLPDCGGGNKTVRGWLGDDVAINTGPRSVNKDTAEVVITVTDPFQIQRADSPTLFSDTYRMVFTLNRMENDP